VTRAEAAARARQGKAAKRQARLALQREIEALKSDVGSALNRLHGASGISLSLSDIDEEYVSELKNFKDRIAIYDRMMNDPVVSGTVRAVFNTMISGVRWSVEGGPAEMRDLIAANLLRQGPQRYWCSTSWTQRLYETLCCLIYGVTLFAKTRTRVGDKIIFKHLKYLHPKSVDEDGWVMDENDQLLEVRRSYMDATGEYVAREPIPASELDLYVWDARGPNYEGNAFIRPFYKPWKLRELAEKLEMVDAQNRAVGIPYAKLSTAGGGVKDRDRLVEMLKNMRGGSKERAFLVYQNDEEVGYLTANGQVKDMKPILDSKRFDIAAAGGTIALEQTNAESGSRAAASALLTPFMLNVDATKVRLEDMVNYGVLDRVGIVEELLALNFDTEGLDREKLPRIVGSRVSPTEVIDNIPNIIDGVQKGAISKTIEIENHVRKSYGAPSVSKEDFDKAALPTHLGGRPTEPDDPMIDDPRDDKDGRRFGLALAEKKTAMIDETRPKRKSAYLLWLSSTTD
jgi:hypothetical protein